MLQRIPVLVDFAEFNPAMSLVHGLFLPVGVPWPPQRLERRTFEALYREHRKRTSTAVEMAFDGRDVHHHTERQRR